VALAHQIHAASLSDGSLGRGGVDRSRGGGLPDALDGNGFGEVGAEAGVDIMYYAKEERV
jgi:hypothetical protein